MTDRKPSHGKRKATSAGSAGDQIAGAKDVPASATHDPAPLCRYEELAMRENHLRNAAIRRVKPPE